MTCCEFEIWLTTDIWKQYGGNMSDVLMKKFESL